MKRIDVVSQFGPGTSFAQALANVAEQLRIKEQGCWLASVDEILTLTQGSRDWKIRYRIHEAKVTRPINPDVARELLEADMLGRSIFGVQFVHNPTRIEEVIVFE
jgi:hypothetical protein